MTSTSPELIDALARIPGLLDGALAPADRAGRAARLAEALRSLWPGADVYVCRLGEVTTTAAIDAAGNPKPQWAAVLDGWPEIGGRAPLVAPLACAGRPYGALGLVGPDGSPEARALLADFADRLALRLYAEEAEQELTEQTKAGDVAEVFGVFLHELGNVLNNLVLDVRLLERDVAEGGRARLAQMGRLASSVPQMLSHIYRFRQGRRTPPGPVDLNRVAGRLVEALRRAGMAVSTDLAADLPAVEGTAGGLSRLVRLLLGQALAVTPPSAGPVTLRTGCAGEYVRLTVEDGGPAVPSEALLHLFEPFITPRHGPSNLELAICKMLVRRLQGRLEAVNRPEGGVAFLADLPVHTARSKSEE
jgi:signal transduction histidine kinase